MRPRCKRCTWQPFSISATGSKPKALPLDRSGTGTSDIFSPITCRLASVIAIRAATHTNRAALHLLGRVMEGTGFAMTRTLTPMDAELSRFDAKMRDVWGYSESTRAARCRIIKRFLIATVGAQAIDINCISESDVSRFIIGDGTRSTSCARGLSGAIRCFLRYRQLIGYDVTPLLTGLPRPPRPKPSTLPDVLTDVEVDALLQSFSADFPQRRRAFAIARCLIDLGMRSS